ncbi:MAG: hypothetical protein AB7N71_09655, partial [Phycisphaerae bacterium]
MATEWQIPRSAVVCTHCERTFDVLEQFHAFVYELDEGYDRRNYCSACLEHAPHGSIGSWRAVRPEPVDSKSQRFDREAIFGFFVTLEDTEDLQKRQFRFVLALLLWRQKVIRFVDSAQDGDAETWQFVEPKNAQTFNVVRPPLEQDEIERLSDQLEKLMAGEAVTLTLIPALEEDADS